MLFLHEGAQARRQPALPDHPAAPDRELARRRAVQPRTHRLPPDSPGRAVLSRARPLVDGMSALVTHALAEADATRSRGPRLRIGSTASRVIGSWLRRLRVALPGTEISLRVDVSAHALLRSVEAGRLDVAFVHEVEGCPLALPAGLDLQRVLLDREPQFISLSRDHPAARRRVVELGDLAGDRWMVDPTVDGEWDGYAWVLGAAWSTRRSCTGITSPRPPSSCSARPSRPASPPPDRATTWRSARCATTRSPSGCSWSPGRRRTPRWRTRSWRRPIGRRPALQRLLRMAAAPPQPARPHALNP
ncbi:hypothetical protein SMICM304S_02448 [Streptomyces microflavus]